ncbi:DNA-directed RNA polymerase subunit D [Candidatus Bathyarchaeota archaeon]|nr:MAG: DNA-directed RNA polymerase subunit D [Candidatus Bathyarchaeota archaeon]
MDIKVLNREQDTLRFVLSDVSPAFANAIRRIILAEVPVMAIDDVMILENSSVMYDEILAHRLGLIPVTTDPTYNLPEECTCKSELVEVVYTSNLKPENPEVKPVSDKIPIVKLAQGQRVKLEAYARLGRGRDHAKWQPASACTYSYDEKLRTFNFLVESTGTLPPEKLVLEAARLINGKTLGFEEGLGAVVEK